MDASGQPNAFGHEHPDPTHRGESAEGSRITLRTSVSLVERVKAAAATEGKSVNAFVTRAIELGLGSPPTSPDEELLVERFRRAGILKTDRTK